MISILNIFLIDFMTLSFAGYERREGYWTSFQWGVEDGGLALLPGCHGLIIVYILIKHENDITCKHLIDLTGF